MRMADLKPGWVVVGNDGTRVGSIREVGQNYILTADERAGRPHLRSGLGDRQCDE